MAYFYETVAVWPEKNFWRAAFFHGGVYMAEIRFASREHNEFFITMLQKVGNSDNFHQAFFYCVGISSTTRKNVNRLYDFDKDSIKLNGLNEGWQTGGTERLTRLAFNLWNGYAEPELERLSTPYEIFDCSYAPYFYEAIKLRYPEYCRDLSADREISTREARKGGR